MELVAGEDETLREIEQAEKGAASNALEEMLDRHMAAMIELRRSQPVENTDLITSKIALSKIPDAVKQNALSLQERMRRCRVGRRRRSRWLASPNGSPGRRLS